MQKLKDVLSFKKNNLGIHVFLLFFIISFFFFKFRIDYNEMDVVPYARAVFNKYWLAEDWYLKLEISYRFFFSFLIGFFADTFGFVKTIIFGRFISYLLVAFSLSHLIKSLKVKNNIFFYFFGLIIFFKIFPKGMGVGEWMVGGLETKVFAYAFAILSLSFFLKNSYKKGVLFVGLSLSFHLLIGIYNIFCLIPLVVFFQRKQHDYWLKILKVLPVFFITGGIGIWGVINHFFYAEKGLSDLGWNIYVNIRVPHHTLPSSFLIEFWIKLLVFSAINVLFLRSKKQEIKLLSWYAVFSVIISLIGLGIYFLLASHHMKYYFFRTSSVILPLVTFLNIMFFLDEKIKSEYLIRRFKLSHLLIVIAILVSFSKVKHFVNDFTFDIKANTLDDVEMVNWVKQNTDENKVFITAPDAKFFYINYERAMFVSWKHSPQASKDIVEWYDRIKLLNKGEDFKKLKEVKKGYLNLTTDDVLAIGKQYKNIGYILMPKQTKLALPVLFQSKKNILYKL